MPKQSIHEIHQLLNNKKLTEAALLAQQLFEKHPNNFDVTLLFGVVALSANDFNSANQLFAIACNLNTNSFEAHFNFGLSLQKSGNFEEAKLHYRNAIRISPNSVPAQVNLAVILEKQNELNKALEIYKDLLKASPKKNPQVLVNIANIYRKKKDYRNAVLTYQEVLVLPNKDNNAHANFGHLLSEMAQFEKAIQQYDTYRQLAPQDSASLIWLANAYLSLGDLTKAEEYFLLNFKSDPKSTTSLIGLSNLEIKRAAFDKALSHANKAYLLAPDEEKTIYTLGMTLSHQTDTSLLERSKTLLTNLTSSNKTHSLGFDCLSKVLGKLGLLDLGIEAANRACSLSPSNLSFKMTLQEALSLAGKIEQAIVVLTDIVKHPNAPYESKRQLGILNIRKNKPKLAKQLLEDAVKHNPLDQRSLAHYVIALQACGDFEQASKIQSFQTLVFNEMIDPTDEFASIEKFNQLLVEEIKSHPSLKWEPKGLATIGGWMTDDLTDAQSPAIACLVKKIYSKINQYRQELPRNLSHPFLGQRPTKFKLHMWAVVLKGSGHVGPHIHEDSWISGAYYAKLPKLGGGKSMTSSDPDNFEGWIEFGQAHQEIPFSFPEQLYRVEPEPGKLVLFPSYYFHQTIPYFDQNERVSIAFDVEAL